MDGELRLLADWPGAQCSRDFCAVTLSRGGREWHLLIGRGHDPVPERELAAACDRVDVVISDRWLPRSCRPAMLKADRRLLARTGGLAIDLAEPGVTTVADRQGEHGWRVPDIDRPRPNVLPSTTAAPNSSVTPAEAGATRAQRPPSTQ